MISWIRGEPVDLWQTGNKYFILLSCKGLGYEIQILESIYIKLKAKKLSKENIILWVKHIKKEDSDSLFGFISRDQKELFIKILNIKGAGAQIGISLLSKFSLNEIVDAINKKDKKLISSVPGIGPKMTERIILELKSILNSEINTKKETENSDVQFENIEIKLMLDDIDFTLQSLNYQKQEIKKIFPILKKHIKNIENKEDEISFEILLKLAMNYLDGNIVI